MFVFANGNVATQAMDSAMMIQMQEDCCWKEYENSEFAPNKQYDDRLGFFLFWLFGEEDKAYEEHRAYLQAKAAEFNIADLPEEERQALAKFLYVSTMMPIVEAEGEVEDADYAKKYMEQKGRVRMKRCADCQHKAYVRSGAWAKNHAKHVERVRKPVSKTALKKEREEQLRMLEIKARDAEYEKEVDICWEEHWDAQYYEDKRVYAGSFYDPMTYFYNPKGEEKDWAEHRAFLEAQKQHQPITLEEVQALAEFLLILPENIPNIDETVFAKEYRKQKGRVTAKRIAARKHKAYERNGSLTANRSRHIKRVRNNVHLRDYGVWPEDVFHPIVRGTINTSRRCADKEAIREGIQEMHFEMQEPCNDAA